MFWQTTLISQALYLEVEAAGVCGACIGFFCNDPVHQAVGLKDLAFRSFYRFTVGAPVENFRLSKLDPHAEASA